MISRPASLSARSTKDSRGQQMTMSWDSSRARCCWRLGTHFHLSHIRVTNSIQVYKHIFTSPTSAKDGSIKLSDVENEAPAPRSRKVVKSKKVIRKDVASSLQMNGRVSSRSIAYAVIQVFCFPFKQIIVINGSSSFSLICGTLVLGLQSMLGLIFTHAIASSSISLMPLVVRTQKHVPGNFWIGGTCSAFFLFQSTAWLTFHHQGGISGQNSWPAIQVDIPQSPGGTASCTRGMRRRRDIYTSSPSLFSTICHVSMHRFLELHQNLLL